MWARKNALQKTLKRDIWSDVYVYRWLDKYLLSHIYANSHILTKKTKRKRKRERKRRKEEEGRRRRRGGGGGTLISV